MTYVHMISYCLYHKILLKLEKNFIEVRIHCICSFLRNKFSGSSSVEARGECRFVATQKWSLQGSVHVKSSSD